MKLEWQKQGFANSHVNTRLCANNVSSLMMGILRSIQHWEQQKAIVEMDLHVQHNV